MIHRRPGSIPSAPYTFVATYEFIDQEAADLAANAPLGERAMAWQEQDADGNRQGLTIAEFGELGGPGFGGCPAGPADQAAPAGTAAPSGRADSPNRARERVVERATWTTRPCSATIGTAKRATHDGSTPASRATSLMERPARRRAWTSRTLSAL